jgi:hypothetical protein
MSLLSTPTGRPDRVFSLISLVHALGGRVSASAAKEWLAPAYRSADNATLKDGERVREVFRVARDLKLGQPVPVASDSTRTRAIRPLTFAQPPYRRPGCSSTSGLRMVCRVRRS